MLVKKHLLLAAVVVLLAGIAGIFTVDALVKDAVETKGSALAGSKVTVGSVNVSPLLGKATFKGVTVANPRGFKSETAFHIKEVEMKMRIGSFFSNPLVLNEVNIIAPDITYEVSFGGGNMAALLKNIAAYNAEKKEKKVVVERLSITEGTMAYGQQTGGEKITIPELQVNNIGAATGGVPVSEATAEALQHFSAHLASVESESLERQLQGLELRVKKMFE